MIADQPPRELPHPSSAQEFKIIAVSSVASVFEWFDFFLYGSLTVIMSRNFFSAVDETSAFVLALLAFAAGFAVRPFGALVFGAVGDRWGRKRTFMITLGLMGGATFAVGLLPTYAQIGPAAPWILVLMRMLQGLSVGGVYGGAAVYVAEHVPQQRRGFFTSFIQITATLGMALSLIVVLASRTALGESNFIAWGWRVPFLLSSILLVFIILIQLRLEESPVYARMKASQTSSTRPWRDAFGSWRNLRLVLIAIFGATVGQAVIWYTAQFYLLFFLERVLKVDSALTNLLMAVALVASTPLYVVFGALSDRIGRRPVILGACLLALLTYSPLFKALTYAANPALSRAIATAPLVVVADKRECSWQLDVVGKATFSSSCDIARSFLAGAGVSYSTAAGPAGSIATLRAGDRALESFQGGALAPKELTQRRLEWEKGARSFISAAGYPIQADTRAVNVPLVLIILFAVMTVGVMSYAPIAAILTELFPAKVRYTSVSFPYHLAIGWCGGFLPSIAFAIVAATGNIFSGLWYTLALSASTLVIGACFLPETKSADITA